MMLACGSSMPPPPIDGFLRTLRPKSSTGLAPLLWTLSVCL
jgi:hypothetical protein